MASIFADEISGTSNDELIRGLGGADTLAGDAGNDTVSGGGGNDFLLGGKGEDVVKGGTGGDTLHGGQGDDSLNGGSGADWLSGDFGADTLKGGSGDDVFAFLERTADMTDTIEDFTAGEDRIELRGFDTMGVSVVDNGVDAEIWYNGTVIALLEDAAGTVSLADIDFI